MNTKWFNKIIKIDKCLPSSEKKMRGTNYQYKE